MMNTKPFDPTFIEEIRDRARLRCARLIRAERAASALLWFDEYAWGQSPSDVVKVSASLVASGTTGADLASQYIRQAALNMAEAIVEEAIRLAAYELETTTDENEKCA